MAKPADRSDCFDKVFLEYLRLRFEFEPLPHYVMAAITVCDSTGDAYPAFVRSFLFWMSERFLFEPSVDRKGRISPLGSYPLTSSTYNPLNAQWSRYEDCHELLDGWLRDNTRAALERQAERIELVKKVEKLRAELREDAPGKMLRQRAKSTKTDAEVFDELEEWFGDEAHRLRRAYKKLALPEEYMSGVVPIALICVDDVYSIETRTAGNGSSWEINLKSKGILTGRAPKKKA